MSRDTALTAGNVAFVEQLIELLDGLDDAVYTGTTELRMSAIGGHVRHCLEFYFCLLEGLESGCVDYDSRRRDVAIETDRAYARELAATVIDRMRAVDLQQAEMPIDVVMDREADTGGPGSCRSSVRRELVFLRSHTVHHFALIAAQLRLQGVDPGADFGVAPSTLAAGRALSKPRA